jgi:hypothetical protein
METRFAPLLIVIPSRADEEEPRIARSRFLRWRDPSVRAGLALSARLRMTAFRGRNV